MIQHDPTGLQPQIPSAKRQGREADELLRGPQRRPWPRAGSVASAHGHEDVAKPWEMLGKTGEKTWEWNIYGFCRNPLGFI